MHWHQVMMKRPARAEQNLVLLLAQTVGGMGARAKKGDAELAKADSQLPVLVSPAQYTVLVRHVPDPRTLSRSELKPLCCTDWQTLANMYRYCASCGQGCLSAWRYAWPGSTAVNKDTVTVIVAPGLDVESRLQEERVVAQGRRNEQRRG